MTGLLVDIHPLLLLEAHPFLLDIHTDQSSQCQNVLPREKGVSAQIKNF